MSIVLCANFFKSDKNKYLLNSKNNQDLCNMNLLSQNPIALKLLNFNNTL
jgi:hypothetical protein